MYAGLGIHWASSVPAFLAVACIPLPFLFYKYGASIRMKCKYAAEADAIMQRIRGQQAAKDQAKLAAGEESVDTSRAATLRAEEEVEEEAHLEETEARFGELKTEKEAEGAELKKVQTGRSTRSRRSVKDNQYYDNPYEIDRVHTRESFVGRPRGNSRASSKK
jgi:hypothetical protein